MVTGVVPERARSSARATRHHRLGIVWEGSFFVHHSLANVNREVAILMAKQNVDLGLLPYEPHQFDARSDPRFRVIARRLNHEPRRVDCHVRHRWPPDSRAPDEARSSCASPGNIDSCHERGSTRCEGTSTRCGSHSNYVRDIYRRSGVAPKKVVVIPLGVNPELFNARVPPARLLPGSHSSSSSSAAGFCAKGSTSCSTPTPRSSPLPTTSVWSSRTSATEAMRHPPSGGSRADEAPPRFSIRTAT